MHIKYVAISLLPTYFIFCLQVGDVVTPIYQRFKFPLHPDPTREDLPKHMYDNNALQTGIGYQVPLGMGRVKTRPEIWPDPRVFWPTRPDPGNFFKDPSQPVIIFS